LDYQGDLLVEGHTRLIGVRMLSVDLSAASGGGGKDQEPSWEEFKIWSAKMTSSSPSHRELEGQ
jgi:hypothetical protein